MSLKETVLSVVSAATGPKPKTPWSWEEFNKTIPKVTGKEVVKKDELETAKKLITDYDALAKFKAEFPDRYSNHSDEVIKLTSLQDAKRIGGEMNRIGIEAWQLAVKFNQRHAEITRQYAEECEAEERRLYEAFNLDYVESELVKRLKATATTSLGRFSEKPHGNISPRSLFASFLDL